jgi:TolB-like protein/class 3 adenylate cyclase/cytochrome c-type biogenesis protein CcmH/NrfG
MEANDRLKRKLAAILHADIVGFSRLSGEDEEGTYRKLRTHLDFFAETIQSHNGCVVNTAGDAVLAEFPTASDALNCAALVQQAFQEKNRDIPEEQRLRFRIGVNLGEVIVDRNDIYGDGVNVAARLEGLAEPGGICISQAVHAAVGRRLDLAYQDIGQQQVKNIAEPVHAYQVLLDGAAPSAKPEAAPRRTAALIAGGLALCLVLAGAGWLGFERLSEETGPEDAMVALEDSLPSIAVLPFQNLGGDAKEDYFSDGITNDIITDLSRFSNLFVIASNSVFTYKGKAVDIKEVGRDLGVRYVLEGSIQKVGNSMRLNAQLIDAKTNHHLWADRYDRELDDIFAVQDELTESIIAALQVTLTEVEKSRTARQYTNSLEAYDLFLRGRSYLRGSRQTHSKAKKLFDQAIALDPDFAAAYAEKSFTYFSGFIMPMSRDPKVVESALAAAERAVALDPNLPLAQARLAWALFANRRHEEAIVAAKRSVALGPSNAESHAQLGNVLNWTGKPEEAIPYLERAMRLNPHHPFYYLFYLGHSHYLLGNHEQAITLMEQVVTRAPYFLPVRRHLAVLYEEAGRPEEARAQTSEVVRIFPGASIEDERARCFYKWEPDLQDRFFDGLRKSGMPEGEPGKEPVEM